MKIKIMNKNKEEWSRLSKAKGTEQEESGRVAIRIDGRQPTIRFRLRTFFGFTTQSRPGSVKVRLTQFIFLPFPTSNPPWAHCKVCSLPMKAINRSFQISKDLPASTINPLAYHSI